MTLGKPHVRTPLSHIKLNLVIASASEANQFRIPIEIALDCFTSFAMTRIRLFLSTLAVALLLTCPHLNRYYERFITRGAKPLIGLAENNPLYLLWILPAKEEWTMLGKLSFFTPAITDKLKSIYTHIFNQQLFDGTLNTHAFGKYLHDDYIYLHHYASTLKKLSTRITDSHPKLALHLTALSEGIVAGEQEMQEGYNEYFQITPEEEPGAAISAYIKFLNHHAEESEIPVALCSILPCFWIYTELGAKELFPDQLTHNPYRDWIATYSGTEFVNATKMLAATVNQLAVQELQGQMEKAFSEAVTFELEFFNEVDPAKSMVFKI